MRHALSSAPLILLLSLHAPASAQVAPDVRYVIAPDLEVRSGPSTSPAFYATNRLHRGATVEVVGERDGWLAIRPPEGSFSYINARFLRHVVPNQPNYVVALEGVEVPVYVGSEIVTDHRPTVANVRLKRGAQVVSVGRTLTDSEGAFMPIEPPPGEVRYIPASAVDRKPLTGAVVTASHADSAVVDNRSSFTAADVRPSSAPSANPPPTPEMLWHNAQYAEGRGQTQEAVRLYLLVASQTIQTNPALCSMAQQRANFLQGGHLTYGAPPAVAAAPVPAVPVSMQATGQMVPWPNDASSGVRLNPPAGAHTSWGNVQTTATAHREPPAPASTLPPGWYAYRGRLYVAGRTVERQTTYRLEVEQLGYTRPTYVVGSPGVNLAPYVGKMVELAGPALYRGDIRTTLLTVYRVKPQ